MDKKNLVLICSVLAVQSCSESIQDGLANDDLRQLIPKHDSGREEAILEDDSAGSYLAEALIMSSVGPDIDKGRIWFYIDKVVEYPKEHGCSGVDAPLLEGVPFEVS